MQFGLQIQVREVCFAHAQQKFGQLQVFQIFLFAALQRLQVVEAVMGDGSHQVRLRVLDGAGVERKPFQESVLHHVFGIGLAAEYPQGNAV